MNKTTVYRLLTDFICLRRDPSDNWCSKADAGAAIYAIDGDPDVIAEFADEQRARSALKAYPATLERDGADARFVKVTSYWVERHVFEIDEDGNLEEADGLEDPMVDSADFEDEPVHIGSGWYKWNNQWPCQAWELIKEDEEDEEDDEEYDE